MTQLVVVTPHESGVMKYRVCFKFLNKGLSCLVLFVCLVSLFAGIHLFLFYDFVSIKSVIIQDDNTKFPFMQNSMDSHYNKVGYLRSKSFRHFLDYNLYQNVKYKKLKAYHKKGLSLRKQFDCKRLFENDSIEQQKVVEFHSGNLNTYEVVSDKDAQEITADCRAFRDIRGYRTDYGSADEKEFPIAYVILAHRDFEHVERLLRTIYMPQHSICIHVDKKAVNLTKAVASLARCFNNVIMASQQQNIVYAHFSRLMADIVCMGDLLAKDTKWRYLINFAATEFPLKSNLEIVKILQLFNGRNDIHEVFERRVEERFTKEYAIIGGRIKQTHILLPPPPYNMTIIKGQAYNTYSREFLQWALTDKRPMKLLEWSKKTYSPDEHYWATLNDLHHNSFLKSPGGFKGHPDKKGYITRFISWQYVNPRFKCQGRTIRNICIFSAFDLPIFLGEMHLAANKFDLTFDPVAYACMEELIENKTVASLPINLHDYSRLYFLNYNNSKR